MKKLILILILIVFSVTQSVAGAISAGPSNIQNGAGDIPVLAETAAVSQNVNFWGTHNEKCCEKHSKMGENGASPCPVDCLLFLAAKFSSNTVSASTNDIVPSIPLTGATLEANFRPPIS